MAGGRSEMVHCLSSELGCIVLDWLEFGDVCWDQRGELQQLGLSNLWLVWVVCAGVSWWAVSVLAPCPSWGPRSCNATSLTAAATSTLAHGTWTSSRWVKIQVIMWDWQFSQNWSHHVGLAECSHKWSHCMGLSECSQIEVIVWDCQSAVTTEVIMWDSQSAVITEVIMWDYQSAVRTEVIMWDCQSAVTTEVIVWDCQSAVTTEVIVWDYQCPVRTEVIMWDCQSNQNCSHPVGLSECSQNWSRRIRLSVQSELK